MRLFTYINSVFAHFVACGMAVFTIGHITIYLYLFTFAPPERMPVSIDEIVQLVRRQPLPYKMEGIHEADGVAEIRYPKAPSEIQISNALANRLDLPLQNVRVLLSEGDGARAELLNRQLKLYSHGPQSDPLILGSFTVGIRSSNGHWHLWNRNARDPQMWDRVAYGITSSTAALVLVFSLLFSARLTRPIRAFSLAAEQLAVGRSDNRIPVIGPTEIRSAATSLNAMQGRIARYVRERSSVVGAIAHDLRAPLARLEFYLQKVSPEFR